MKNNLRNVSGLLERTTSKELVLSVLVAFVLSTCAKWLGYPFQKMMDTSGLVLLDHVVQLFFFVIVAYGVLRVLHKDDVLLGVLFVISPIVDALFRKYVFGFFSSASPNIVYLMITASFVLVLVASGFINKKIKRKSKVEEIHC